MLRGSQRTQNRRSKKWAPTHGAHGGAGGLGAPWNINVAALKIKKHKPKREEGMRKTLSIVMPLAAARDVWE